MTTAKRVYHPSEVASCLGVSRTTIYKWVKDGVLVAVNVSAAGRRPIYRVYRSDLVVFMRERSMTEDLIREVLASVGP